MKHISCRSLRQYCLLETSILLSWLNWMAARDKHGAFAARSFPHIRLNCGRILKSGKFCQKQLAPRHKYVVYTMPLLRGLRRTRRSGSLNYCAWLQYQEMLDIEDAAIVRDSTDLMLVVSLWDSSDLTPFRINPRKSRRDDIQPCPRPPSAGHCPPC